MSDYIYVRAVPGRIARESPTGPFIPHDRYVPVRNTPYVSRLLRFHQDIELEPKAKKAEPKPAEAPASKAEDKK